LRYGEDLDEDIVGEVVEEQLIWCVYGGVESGIVDCVGFVEFALGGNVVHITHEDEVVAGYGFEAQCAQVRKHCKALFLL
jgi:hypothetical protein